MDCSQLSPFFIDVLNFSLTFIAYMPAVILSLWAFYVLNKRVETKYPGIDNRNMRTYESTKTLFATLLVFFFTWYAGLVLTEGFRCISS